MLKCVDKESPSQHSTSGHTSIELSNPCLYTYRLTKSFAICSKENVPALGGASGPDVHFAMRQPCPSTSANLMRNEMSEGNHKILFHLIDPLSQRDPMWPHHPQNRHSRLANLLPPLHLRALLTVPQLQALRPHWKSPPPKLTPLMRLHLDDR